MIIKHVSQVLQQVVEHQLVVVSRNSQPVERVRRIQHYPAAARSVRLYLLKPLKLRDTDPVLLCIVLYFFIAT